MGEQMFVDGVMAIVILWGAAALGVLTYLVWKKVADRD